ncbi:hypothetical protein [Yinghuangia soli]|uniref:Uncharacterized protein n=1 Tax=Yinghuangia soli TaxID=2908204 RepID=A0AA41U0B9_9ACTN|nr:hypothetical protein [Yinghuangia soli]MCF2526277.1 hypothetical protein [Yinghuangia soli]
MDDTRMFGELLRRLNADDCAAAPRPGGEAIEISRWAGTDLPDPMVLEVSPASLGDRLRATAADAVQVFPSAEPATAALQLLVVHIQEALKTRPPGSRRLLLEPGGVRAT